MDVSWSNFFSNLLFILTCFFHYTTTLKQEGGCYFPERWEGTWFQSGVRQPILIEGPRLSSKGRCLASEGDKFLVVDDKKCYRCVVIHEKHANVLQYKETFCLGRDSLASLCSLITGDALLYSMFRENASPVSCPFRGPYTFTYNRGHGECRYPVSSIDSCTEDSRLLLSYQACPDVHGTESTVEELQCLATWKEGSSRYLVGKVHHSHATSNEDRFRCFVYEKSSPTSESLDGVDYRVAQSGDATCNGLFSASEGSRTMTLKRAPSLNKCRFPSWLANFNHWHTLDYTATYSFHHRNSTLRVTNSSGLEMKVVCSQVKHQARDDSSVMIVAHFTTGCQSGYMCVVFYRRDSHVMEVQTGLHSRRPEDSCTPLYFNKTAQPYVTLVTTTPEPRKCPYLGKFAVTTLITGGGGGNNGDRRVVRSSAHKRRFTQESGGGGESGGGRKGSRYVSYDTRRFQDDEFETGAFEDEDDGGGGGNVMEDAMEEVEVYREDVGGEVAEMDHHQGGYGFGGSGGQGGRRQHTRRIKRVNRGDGDCDSSDGGFSALVVGCNSIDTMEFHSECSAPDLILSYSCHGRWEENGTHYLITTPLSRASHGARRYCFIYKEVAGTDVVLFSTSSDSCDRTVKPGATGGLVFNATSKGKCIEVNSSHSIHNHMVGHGLPVLLALCLICLQHLIHRIER